MQALKARLADTQANLKPLAAAALGHLIASLDPETGGGRYAIMLQDAYIIYLRIHLKNIPSHTFNTS